MGWLFCFSSGLIDLFGKKKDKEFHNSRVVRKAFSSVLLVFIAVIPVLLFPEYELPAPTGKYEVTSVRYTYVDESRIEEYADTGEHRKINIEFWYPEIAGGAYPLVIFSHGGLGEKRSNVSLFTELASHGYVVCTIDHPYQSLWTKDEDGHITFLSKDYFGEITREDAKIDKEQSYEYYQKWMGTRTADINFVLDTILKNAANNTNDVYNLIDSERIGVMGHSLGGSAALAIPWQRDDVDAVIALESPFLYDIIDVDDGEFVFVDQAYPAPVLNIYSDGTWGHLSE